MKYEMIFGDASLFDGKPSKAVAVDLRGNTYEKSALELIGSGGVAAMRRIIAEPKRWTVEDQKAGRPPEVGCVVMAIDVNEVARIAAINNDSVCSVCVVFEDGGFITLHLSGIAPIETPAEKAQREEDEWVNKAWSETAVFAGVTQDEHDRLRIHLRHIYRAQLSGELAAPKGGE